MAIRTPIDKNTLAAIRILAGKRRMMLKGILSFLNADLLWVLAAMGHGDELAVVDRNFSADRVARKTSSGRLIMLPGVHSPAAINGILQLMPLDTFVESPASHMTSIDNPEQVLDVHQDVISVCSNAERRNTISRPIERHRRNYLPRRNSLYFTQHAFSYCTRCAH